MNRPVSAGLLRLGVAAALVCGCSADMASTAPTASAAPTASPAPAGWTIGRTPSLGTETAAPPRAIAVAPGGRAVVVGDRVYLDPIAPAEPRASVWWSHDLVDWSPATLDRGLELGPMVPLSGPLAGMADVTWGDGGFVAVGTSDPAAARPTGSRRRSSHR